MGDRPPWTNRRLPETPGVPTLQQMFALAQRMGYEMRPISRQTDAPRQQSGGRPPVGQDRGFRPQQRTGRDYSKFRCFSCGQFGYMQARCPKPDASLPYKPAGWFLQSEGNGQRDGRNRTEKLTLGQDFTHPGLHAHHSTLIHPPIIRSSWDSSSPNDTVACVGQSSGSPGPSGSSGSSGSLGSS